ncbi:MAG: hypothetical protein LBT53_01420, partial [Puniceicoccales bacterium]|nr:hypothetical protein [Puniceicoccales bacterium]
MPSADKKSSSPFSLAGSFVLVSCKPQPAFDMGGGACASCLTPRAVRAWSDADASPSVPQSLS